VFSKFWKKSIKNKNMESVTSDKQLFDIIFQYNRILSGIGVASGPLVKKRGWPQQLQRPPLVKKRGWPHQLQLPPLVKKRGWPQQQQWPPLVKKRG
jgi:hypothetical protein